MCVARRVTWFVWLLASAAAAALGAASRQDRMKDEYAGTEACKDCHKEQYAGFVESYHRRYVRPATPAAVIGDFTGNNVLVAGGAATKMLRRGDEFFVQTTGPDGQVHEYRCERTIGFHYKQRYLTTLPDGEYILPVQWNRNEQRWVDYHGLAKAKPGSGDFWCDPPRASATDCAGCHGTGVRLEPMGAGRPPRVVQAEPAIGCEACHGPCAQHARDEKNPRLIEPISLKKLSPQRQTDVCGQCHARGKDPEAGTAYPYLFRPGDRLVRVFEPLEPTIGAKSGAFWPDGCALSHHQQWTDFVGSAHYTRAGMSCTSCHEPHARQAPGMLKLKAGGKPNDLCVGCHTALRGDEALKAHAFHDPAQAGGACVECHMPRLVSNERPLQLRFHGASIPNPHKTLLWGAPNACNLCHNDPAKGDTPERMLDAMKKWGVPARPIRTKPD